MNEQILIILNEIFELGKEQLTELNEGRINRVSELDKRKELLISQLTLLEKSLPSSCKTENKKEPCLSEADRAKAKELTDKIVSLNSKISDSITKQMRALSEELNRINKLREAFCPPCLFKAPGKNININV